jgi:type VI secretion system ImpM family protein
MLGSITHNHRWTWAAVGKHPSAKDYIRLGGASPLLDAVAQWFSHGYQELRRVRQGPAVYYAWRFWLRGIKKGTLICGLGRESSDSIGRPYPLLILGEGTVRAWEKQWTRLPVRLEKLWRGMEVIAAHRFDNTLGMEEALTRLPPPDADTTAVTEREAPEKGGKVDVTMHRCKEQLLSDGFGMVSLNPPQGSDPYPMVLACHHRLKMCCAEIPRAVFMGGPLQQVYLAVIRHPLETQDFFRLWTC